MKIAICDDEKAIREQINELIEKEKARICPDLYETGMRCLPPTGITSETMGPAIAAYEKNIMEAAGILK